MTCEIHNFAKFLGFIGSIFVSQTDMESEITTVGLHCPMHWNFTEAIRMRSRKFLGPLWPRVAAPLDLGRSCREQQRNRNHGNRLSGEEETPTGDVLLKFSVESRQKHSWTNPLPKEAVRTGSWSRLSRAMHGPYRTRKRAEYGFGEQGSKHRTQ